MQARLEAEELKRAKFASKKGHGAAVIPAADTDSVQGNAPAGGMMPPPESGVPAQAAPPRLSTPEVAEKVCGWWEEGGEEGLLLWRRYV